MKTSKKLLAFLLSAALLVSTLIIPGMVVSADNAEIDVWDGQTASTTYDGGSGDSANDPYLISTGEQLAGAIFNGGGNKYYKLTADIYLNDVTDADWKNNNPNVWTTDTLFNGYIDGDNHIIYGLYYNAAAGIPAALIPKNGKNTTLSNLGLSEAYVSSNHYVGGFLGFSDADKTNNANSQGNFTNCFIDETCYIATTHGSASVGGLIGYFGNQGTSKVVIDTCYVTATVAIDNGSNTGAAGGLLGRGNNLDYQIKNSYTTTAQAVGHNRSGAKNKSANANPFVNVYATANASDYMVGKTWNVVSAAQMTGLSALDNMSALSKDTWTAVEGKTPVLTQFLDKPEEEPEDPSEGKDGVWDGKTDSTTYDGGSGDSANDPYLISTGEQLAGAIFNGGGNKYYKLTADIYLNDVTDPNWKDNTPNSWTTDTLFNGYIDGDNHIIYGLYYNAAAGKPAALIPQNGKNTTISNLGLSEAYVVSNHYVGGFLAWSAETDNNANSQGIFTNCFIDETCYIATTHGTASVGGLIGYFANKGTSKLVIDTCSVTATVVIDNESNTGAAGGLLGRGTDLNYQIKNSYTTSAQAVGHNRNGTRNPSKNADPFVNVYATANVNDYVKKAWNVVSAEQMIGLSAKSSMSDLDYTVWMPVKNGTPVLRSFAEKLGVEEDLPVITEVNGVWNGNVAGGFAAGKGTEDEPYLIQDAGELALMVKNGGQGKFYKLTKDIKLNDVSASNWAENVEALNKWNNYGTAFAGTIDGAGHIIYGLYISDSTDNDGGLLAKGSSAGTHFKNIGIRKSVVNGGKYTGAFISLAEKNNISFDQVFIDETVTVTGTQYVSGLVGRVGNNNNEIKYTATFNNCYSTASVTGGSTWNSGITSGYQAAYQITDSYSFGYISNTGVNDKYVSLTSPAYVNCFAGHAPSQKDINKGNNWTTLADWEMKGFESAEKMASLIGDGSVWTIAKDSTPVLVQFADSLDAVTEMVTVTYKNWDGAILKEATVFVGETVEEPETPSKMVNGLIYEFIGWDKKVDTNGNETYTATFGKPSVVDPSGTEIDGIWNGKITQNFDSGSGKENDPYIISSAGELAFAITSGGNGKYYKLTKDIYLNYVYADNWHENSKNNPWFTGVTFTGYFDGNGHTVYGLWYPEDDSTVEGRGLFPILKNGNVKNIGVDKARVFSLTSGAGGIVGLSDGTVNINNCFAEKDVFVKGISSVGGIVGKANNSSVIRIDGCYSRAEVIATTTNKNDVNLACGILGGAYQVNYIISNSFSVGENPYHCASNSKRKTLAGDNAEELFATVYSDTTNGDSDKSRTFWNQVSRISMTGANALDSMSGLDRNVWCAVTEDLMFPTYRYLAARNGDLDGDGTFNKAKDMAVLYRVILNGLETYINDVNGDGKVDVCDLVALAIKDEVVKEEVVMTPYTPKTVTLSIYDSNSSSYGVNWQTQSEPKNPVVQISKGDTFNAETAIEFAATYTKEQSYGTDGKVMYYYVSKAVLSGLELGTTYTYRCVDKGANAIGETFTFKTRDNSNSFKFVNVSDSQTKAEVEDSANGAGTGTAYGNTMAGVEINGFDPDFILHSGDIVEYSKYESYWDAMINDNANYFAENPMAIISGNHDTTYKSGDGSKEIYKHFNIDTSSIPEGNTNYGFSYAYDYGNTKFIMLNTNNGAADGKLSDATYAWLVNVLKNNNQKWTIVSMHAPMYSPGQWGSDTGWKDQSLALREQLSDLFAEYGVDIVLQGHDHIVSKTYPIGVGGTIQTDYEYETINGIKYYTGEGGVLYVMNGTAGGSTKRTYDTAETEYYDYSHNGYASTWSEIEVSENTITVNVYYYNNGTPKLLTAYGIKK